MPKTEEKYRKIREAQRENILSAARAAVLRHGWAATMADIASEAKISQGLAYRYFESKEAIFFELFSRMLEKMLPLIESPDAGNSPTLRLKALINKMLSTSDIFGNFEIAVRSSYEKSSMFSLSNYLRSDDENSRKLIEIMKNKLNVLSETLSALIEEGQKTGEFKSGDPQKLTLVFLSSIKGMTHLAVHHPEAYKAYFPYTDIIMRLVLNESYKAPEAGDGTKA